jgi:hypothetical protein
MAAAQIECDSMLVKSCSQLGSNAWMSICGTVYAATVLELVGAEDLAGKWAWVVSEFLMTVNFMDDSWLV